MNRLINIEPNIQLDPESKGYKHLPDINTLPKQEVVIKVHDYATLTPDTNLDIGISHTEI